jgi:hypothetical protein
MRVVNTKRWRERGQPTYVLTTERPLLCACFVMMLPMSRYLAPGLHAAMAFSRHSYVVFTSLYLESCAFANTRASVNIACNNSIQQRSEGTQHMEQSTRVALVCSRSSIHTWGSELGATESNVSNHVAVNKQWWGYVHGQGSEYNRVEQDRTEWNRVKRCLHMVVVGLRTTLRQPCPQEKFR